MHVWIERLYEFAMGTTDLTENETCHLNGCTFCVAWLLDACAEEKVPNEQIKALFTNSHTDSW